MLAMIGLPPYLCFPVGDLYLTFVHPWVQWAVVTAHVFIPKVKLQEELRAAGFDVGLFDEVIIV